MQIRAAVPGEGERLREITAASKAHWDYDPELVRDWAASLDFSPDRIRNGELYVAQFDDRLVGWVEILSPVDGVCVLEDLWIEPAWIRKEIGSQLFRFAADRARALGARTMEWGAEPNAIGFYEKMGGRYLRDKVSEWGRLVTVMYADLE
jgi:GNAT superfamily N-acetyltransferase